MHCLKQLQLTFADWVHTAAQLNLYMLPGSSHWLLLHSHDAMVSHTVHVSCCRNLCRHAVQALHIIGVIIPSKSGKQSNLSKS